MLGYVGKLLSCESLFPRVTAKKFFYPRKMADKTLEARDKLREILTRAEKIGCRKNSLIKLQIVEKLIKKSSADEKNSGIFKYRVFFGICGILTVFFYVTNAHTLQGFSSIWLKWNYGNVNEQPCTIPMPDDLVKIFRPPVHCSMCESITEVEKVANLTPDIFENRYAYTGHPVVITDGMVNWTAQHVFSFNFFKKIYETRMEQWSLYNCQFFPYKTEFTHLSEVFNMSQDRAFMVKGTKPWYVGWSNCDDEINQILRKHYHRPYFLPTTAETKKLDWIFMGSSGYGAPMHVDNVEHPSWQAQLRGRKKWSLQPPPECLYSCRNLEVIVEPGEIIVLDTNRWYHSTLIISDEMSITIGAEYD